MDATPASLLDELRKPDPADAWGRFVHLFTPLLVRWAARIGVPAGERADLVQDVFVTLLRVLPRYAYDPSRSFRVWLFAVAANRWRDARRRPSPVPLPAGADPPDPAADLVPADEAEYRAALVGRAVQLARGDFGPTAWHAFRATAMEGRPAAAVAAELKVSVNAVYQARARVLRRLRAELAGLLD